MMKINSGPEKNIVFSFTMAVFFLVSISGLDAQKMSGREIMARVEMKRINTNRGYDMTMTLIDRNQNRQTKVFRIYSKSYQDVKKQIIIVKKPARLKNMGFLMFDYMDGAREDDQWIYLPASGRPKRIALSDRGGSFMGSDLNYADLTSKPLDDYSFRIIKEARIKEQDTWLIESLPVSQDVIRKTGYMKSVIAVEKKFYDVIRIKLWCEGGHTVKLHDLNDFKVVDGGRIPTDILVVKKQGRITMHMTHLKINNIRTGHLLPDNLFTLRQLEKGINSEKAYP